MKDDSISDQNSVRLRDWQQGVDHFNAQRFWEAHEAWERGWLKLPPLEKIHVQVQIQGAGVFYLIEKRRMRGARSLAEAALNKIQTTPSAIRLVYPRIEIPGLEQVLEDFVQKQVFPSNNSLRARLLLSPA